MKKLLRLTQFTCFAFILLMIAGTIFSYCNDANWKGLTQDLMWYYFGLVGLIVVIQVVIVNKFKY